jgi:hypothetical protein
MVMTRSKKFNLRVGICGRSMILGHTIFFQDGVAIEF